MHYARNPTRRLRYPDGCSPNIGTAPLLPPISRARIVRVDFPIGIVGRRSNHPHGMTLIHEPSRHFTGVLADSRGLRGKIGAVEQDLHRIHPPFDSASAYTATLILQ